MIIAFFGHRTISSHNSLSEQIKNEIDKYISSGERVRFYCGGIGDFDYLCAKACVEIKKKSPDCELILISPYINFISSQNIKYDGIVYPPLENVPLKFAISHRNRWMVDKADVIIAYIEHSFGGAYRAVEYARRKNKRFINLADFDKDSV